MYVRPKLTFVSFFLCFFLSHLPLRRKQKPVKGEEGIKHSCVALLMHARQWVTGLHLARQTSGDGGGWHGPTTAAG